MSGVGGGDRPRKPSNDSNSQPSSHPSMLYGRGIELKDLILIAKDMHQTFTESTKDKRQAFVASASQKATRAATTVREGAAVVSGKMAEGAQGVKRRLSVGLGMAAQRLDKMRGKAPSNSYNPNEEEEEEQPQPSVPAESLAEAENAARTFVTTVINYLLDTIKTNIVELGSASVASVQARQYIEENQDSEAETMGFSDEPRKVGIAELCTILDQVEYIPDNSDEGMENYVAAVRRTFPEDSPIFAQEYFELVMNATYLTDINDKFNGDPNAPFDPVKREAFRAKQINALLVQHLLAQNDNYSDEQISSLYHSSTMLRTQVVNAIGNLFAGFNENSRADVEGTLETIADSLEHLSKEQNNNVMLLSQSILLLLKFELKDQGLDADLSDERVQAALMSVMHSRGIQQKISELATSIILSNTAFIEEQASPDVPQVPLNFARTPYKAEFWTTILEKIVAHLENPTKFIADVDDKKAALSWAQNIKAQPAVRDLLDRLPVIIQEYTNTKSNPTANQQALTLSELVDKINPNWKGSPTVMEDGSEDYLELDPIYVELKTLLMQMAEVFRGGVIDLGRKPHGSKDSFQAMLLDFVHNAAEHTPTHHIRRGSDL